MLFGFIHLFRYFGNNWYVLVNNVFFSLSVCFHYRQQAFFTKMGHPVKSTMLLLENQFFNAGKIMAMSIVQGGTKHKIYTSLSEVKSYCHLKSLTLMIHFLRGKK